MQAFSPHPVVPPGLASISAPMQAPPFGNPFGVLPNHQIGMPLHSFGGPSYQPTMQGMPYQGSAPIISDYPVISMPSQQYYSSSSQVPFTEILTSLPL